VIASVICANNYWPEQASKVHDLFSGTSGCFRTSLDMTFYFFELIDGETLSEAGGYDCEDVDEAKDIARALAIRLASSQQRLVGKAVAVVARSEDEQEVYRVGVDAVNKLLAN
jgi:hypothetical protein